MQHKQLDFGYLLTSARPIHWRATLSSCSI